jgi:hypothetical protein
LKRTAELRTPVFVEARPQERTVTTHLAGRNKRCVSTPQRVASVTEDGQLLETRDGPRSAFRSRRQEMAWGASASPISTTTPSS